MFLIYLVKVLNPKYDLARYYKAWLESLLDNKAAAILNLKIAINSNKEFKKKAFEDPDFNNIKDSKEFRELI